MFFAGGFAGLPGRTDGQGRRAHAEPELEALDVETFDLEDREAVIDVCSDYDDTVCGTQSTDRPWIRLDLGADWQQSQVVAIEVVAMRTARRATVAAASPHAARPRRRRPLPTTRRLHRRRLHHRRARARVCRRLASAGYISSAAGAC